MSGDEFEQALVDAAEFLGAKVAVVDESGWGVLRMYNSELSNGSEQCTIC